MDGSMCWELLSQGWMDWKTVEKDEISMDLLRIQERLAVFQWTTSQTRQMFDLVFADLRGMSKHMNCFYKVYVPTPIYCIDAY